MAKAHSVSLKHFTTAVQSAVKAAVEKHPKFKVEVPEGVSFSYIIRGIPVAEKALTNVTFAEAQSFANDIAKGLSAHPSLANLGLPGEGSIYSHYPHIILGIPAPDPWILEE